MVVGGALYEYQPSFILGFHGCDASTGEKILSGAEVHLRKSEKVYDWLGSGIYFWEGSLARAWEWANAKRDEGTITTPFVLGAIIDLRHCLDLFDRGSMDPVKQAYGALKNSMTAAAIPMPKNVGLTPDKGGRLLDCAVMNLLHTMRADKKQEHYDSVRGPFLEGRRVYRGSGFRSHNHIQICVRETACIKGYFRPINDA